MPIDLDLLRHEETREQVIQWQELRYPNNSDHRGTILPRIQRADEALRKTQRDINVNRNLLKSLQKSLAPAAALLDNRLERINEIQALKTRLIDMETTILELQEEIDVNMSLVANELDMGVSLQTDNVVVQQCKRKNSKTKQVISKAVLDPMFCIRGYERIRFTTANGQSSTLTFLTGVGASLDRALTSYALTFLHNATLISLPSNIPSVMSATTGTIESHATMPAMSTSLIGLSLLHQSTKYLDRELPLRNVCITPHELNNNKAPSQQQPHKWFHSSRGGHSINVFAITGGTMTESRAVQMEFLNTMKTFYSSLLMMQDDFVDFELVALDPAQLLPQEASRVVLYYDTVIVGHVSNMTDYITRGINTKSQNGTPVHTVHGCFCVIHETLEFMVQRNVIWQDETASGVGIPRGVARGMQEFVDGIAVPESSFSWAWIPFHRQLEAKENGKVCLTVLHNVVTGPRWMPGATTNSSTITSTMNKPKRAPFAIHHNGVPTKREIQAEALTLPFTFLPML